MRCISRTMCYVFSSVLLFSAGCGNATDIKKGPARSYNLYETTAKAGISVTESVAEKSFFSENLCVTEDISLGTDKTDAQVAEGAGAFDLATNTVVYAKNIYDKLYPASTTKILTAYIALNYCDDMDAYVTISENAANQASDSSVCGLKAGDIVQFRDLLYGMMVQSGNDASIAIAEHISGSVEAFAELMNREARLLGATQSHFVNPNGLPDPEHYTSVYDLYLLFSAALADEQFVDLIQTKTYNVAYTNAKGETVEKTWNNTNQYLTGHTKSPEGFTVIGGKTGTTGEAGYCLVLYSKNQFGNPIISIVLKADGKHNLYLLMNQMLSGYAA